MTWQYGLLCALGLAVNGALLGPALYKQQGSSDYLAFYVGGRLAASGRLYDRTAQLDVQREIGRQNPQLRPQNLLGQFARSMDVETSLPGCFAP